MAPPGPTDLVRLAIDEPRRARLIGMALSALQPTEAPAALLQSALDRGAIRPDIAIELLGCVRHGAGYTLARSCLYNAERREAAFAAGIAMARIGGADADADLTVALWAAPEREGREGAALGLCELGEAHHAEAIYRAAREGKIRVRVAAGCSLQLPFDPVLLLELLRSETGADRRLGTELVYELLAQATDEAELRLRELGDEGRWAVQVCLEDPNLTMLPDKRGALEAWVYADASSSG